jgi:hypothetical protein
MCPGLHTFKASEGLPHVPAGTVQEDTPADARKKLWRKLFG